MVSVMSERKARVGRSSPQARRNWELAAAVEILPKRFCRGWRQGAFRPWVSMGRERRRRSSMRIANQSWRRMKARALVRATSEGVGRRYAGKSGAVQARRKSGHVRAEIQVRARFQRPAEAKAAVHARAAAR